MALNDLEVLGLEYLQTAEKVKTRVTELRHELKQNPKGDCKLYHRMAMLDRIAQETREIGCYLRDYYKH